MVRDTGPPGTSYQRAYRSPDRHPRSPPPLNRGRALDNGRRSRSPDRYRRNDDMYNFRGNNYPERDDRGAHRYRSRSRSRSPYRPRYGAGSRSPSRRGGESYRPDNSRRNEPGANDFTFRYQAPPAVDQGLRSIDTYQPLPRGNFQSQPYSNAQAYNRNRQGNQGNYNRNGRPPFSKKAADRPFLVTNRAPTPELMPGMDEDVERVTKFRAVDDMSDSEEAEMDLSDDEHDSGEVVEQPVHKKQARDSKAADGDSVPRWSNPDPYTALPPPDESQRKKKDVVKLIRKARMDAIHDAPKPSATSDDFISFDFDGDQQDFGVGMPGAPSGPSYSHKEILHGKTPLALQQKPAQTMLGNHQVTTHAPPKPLPQQAKKRIEIDLTDDDLSRSQLVTQALPAPRGKKRTFDEAIKPPPRTKQLTISKGGPPPKGGILKEWLPGKDTNITPWCKSDYCEATHVGSWLHREILDFYEHFKPRDFEQKIRRDLILNLREAVKKPFYGEADIRPFGSYVAGLYLPTADMDLVLVSDRYLATGFAQFCSRRDLDNFAQFITHEKIAQKGSITPIYKAKVPLVKYVDRVTGLRVDVSFENTTGLAAIDTFLAWKKQFPALPILVTLIKQFLAMRGVNEPVNGGIGGFTVICLVVTLLQHSPTLMNTEHHLGDLLLRFFDFYGNQFNVANTAILMKNFEFVDKEYASQTCFGVKLGKEKFCIIDPLNNSNDIAGGAANTPTIVRLFSRAFDELRKVMSDLDKCTTEERRGKSILGSILGGDYTIFDEQREHLRYLDSFE